MSSKGIPVAERAHLRQDYTELGAEPGGGAAPLQLHSAPNRTPGEGTGDVPAPGVPPIDNGVSFDEVAPPMAEGESWILPPKVRSRSHVIILVFVMTCISAGWKGDLL
jgi:hypothetical protein